MSDIAEIRRLMPLAHPCPDGHAYIDIVCPDGRSIVTQCRRCLRIYSPPRCPQCGNAGWVLDAKINRTPTTLELIPCIYPECEFSGRAVGVLCLYGAWGDPIMRPDDPRAVMSLRPVTPNHWTERSTNGVS